MLIFLGHILQGISDAALMSFCNKLAAPKSTKCTFPPILLLSHIFLCEQDVQWDKCRVRLDLILRELIEWWKVVSYKWVGGRDWKIRSQNGKSVQRFELLVIIFCLWNNVSQLIIYSKTRNVNEETLLLIQFKFVHTTIQEFWGLKKAILFLFFFIKYSKTVILWNIITV